MRVLIDEHFDVRLYRLFGEGFEAETVEYRGWKGTSNGELLKRASEDGYEAFVTNDGGIPHQQQLDELGLRVVVFEVPSNELADQEPLMPKVEKALRDMHPGEIRRVKAPT